MATKHESEYVKYELVSDEEGEGRNTHASTRGQRYACRYCRYFCALSYGCLYADGPSTSRPNHWCRGFHGLIDTGLQPNRTRGGEPRTVAALCHVSGHGQPRRPGSMRRSTEPSVCWLHP